MSLADVDGIKSSVPTTNVGPVINVDGVVYAWDGAQYVNQTVTASPKGMKVLGGNGPRRVIFLGDSLTASAPLGGWADLFCLLSNGQYINVYNGAVPGYTAKQVLDNAIPAIPATVIADEMHFMIGTNSPGVTDDNRNSFVSIIDYAIGRGWRPVVSACPPTSGAPSADWNWWVNEWCVQNNIEFFNPWALLLDPATGGMVNPTYSLDGGHPTFAGYLLAAKRKLLDIQPGFSATDGSGYWPGFALQSSATGIGLLATPWLNTGVAGGLCNVFSNVAVGNVTGATNTPTNSANVAPLVGNYQRFTIANLPYASTGGYYKQTRSLSGLVVGHRYRVVEWLDITTFTEVTAKTGQLAVQVRNASSQILVANSFAGVCKGWLVREFIATHTTGTLEYFFYGAQGGNSGIEFSIANQQMWDITAQSALVN